jgi:hypothetical protein
MSDVEERSTTTPSAEVPGAPPKRDYRTLFIALAFGLGLVLLIGLNMS